MSDMGLLSGIIALISMSTFLGICWWAYRPASRRRFDEDAWMVFDEDEIEILDGDRKHVRRQPHQQRLHKEGGRA